jgi:hypothetical protein
MKPTDCFALEQLTQVLVYGNASSLAFGISQPQV